MATPATDNILCGMLSFFFVCPKIILVCQKILGYISVCQLITPHATGRADRMARSTSKRTVESTKAVGYIRVSTEKQADHGVSLEAQQAKLTAYAHLYDLELVEVI